MKPFRLHEPTTADEAVLLLARLGAAAKLYAGGTELLLAMKAGFLQYEDLVNVKTVGGMDDIAYDEAAGVLSIGAGATHRSLESSVPVRERYPLLADVERRVANVRVRNVGTIGGNLCFAEPHSDPGAALLLFDAQVEATGASGTRLMGIEELQTGPYETGLREDELLTRIIVPRLPDGMQGVYLKFGYHHRPTLGMGVAVKLASSANGARARPVIDDVRIALGSVSPRPVRVREAEDLLRGAGIDDVLRADGASPLLADAAYAAVRAAEAMDDMHGSAEYKEHLVRVFLGRAVRDAIAAAGSPAGGSRLSPG